jgi:hypothetical protein
VLQFLTGSQPRLRILRLQAHSSVNSRPALGAAMGVFITMAVPLLVVGVMGWTLVRRGRTSASWEGREPGQQKKRDTGGGWIPK